MRKLRPSDLPHTGHGQTFRLVGTAPYVNAKGETRLMSVVETECHTCGATFRTLIHDAGAFVSRRCENHKRAGTHAKGAPHWLRCF